MAEHRSALGAACPVLAGAIVGASEPGTARLRTGKHVTHGTVKVRELFHTPTEAGDNRTALL
jgi:hypothetical protein